MIRSFVKEEIFILLVQLIAYLILVSCVALLLAKLIFGYNIVQGDSSVEQGRKHYHHSMFKTDDHVHVSYSTNEERIAVFDVLTPSKVYKIPDAMPHIGDKSDSYATLRQEFDAKDLPEVPKRLNFDLAVMEHTNSDQVSYDIYDCPDTPPDGYPFDWTLMDILKSWPPDDPKPRPKIFQGLCVFDFTTDYQKAMTYRQLEVPFIVVNDPQVQETVKRWNAPNYMETMLGSVRHRTELSVSCAVAVSYLSFSWRPIFPH